MFTIKLGTGKTFEATAVEERYSSTDWNESANGGLALQIECSAAPQELSWYLGLLQETGALDEVTVLSDGKVCMEKQGYTDLSDISVRLLATGERHLAVSLHKELRAPKA